MGFEPTTGLRPQRLSRPPHYRAMVTSPRSSNERAALVKVHRLGDRDSNPDLLIQSQLYYHYTIPHRRCTIGGAHPTTGRVRPVVAPTGFEPVSLP